MSEQELLLRFHELRRAVRDRDEMERRWREHSDDTSVRELSLAACERVLSRRAALYRCLIRQGWTPPADVTRHLLEDEALLAEAPGSVGG